MGKVQKPSDSVLSAVAQRLTLCCVLGTMVSVCVFSHVLKIDDALIGVMSCTSKILASFVYAFSTTDWQIYLGT
jgi:hypothetical protein